MDSVKGLFGALTQRQEVVGTEAEQESLLGGGGFRNSAGVSFTRAAGSSVGSMAAGQMGAAAAAAAAVAKGYSDRPDPEEGGGTGEFEPAANPNSLLGRAAAAASVVRSASTAAAGAAATATQSAKIAAGLEEAPPKTAMEEVADCGCCPSMSRKTRLLGFVICYGIGTFFWLLSTPAIPLIFIKPAKFAVPYTLGSLISMGSTMFMVGPAKQIKNMCKEDRRLTTSIYLGSMIGTLVFAMLGGIIGTVLCIACIVAQFLSMVWYVASYVPGGQTMVKVTFNKCVACCPSFLSTCWSCCTACCCRG